MPGTDPPSASSASIGILNIQSAAFVPNPAASTINPVPADNNSQPKPRNARVRGRRTPPARVSHASAAPAAADVPLSSAPLAPLQSGDPPQPRRSGRGRGGRGRGRATPPADTIPTIVNRGGEEASAVVEPSDSLAPTRRGGDGGGQGGRGRGRGKAAEAQPAGEGSRGGKRGKGRGASTRPSQKGGGGAGGGDGALPLDAAPPVEPLDPAEEAAIAALPPPVRVMREIAGGGYECMICVMAVVAGSTKAVCQRCYSVFHSNCLTAWWGQSKDPSGKVLEVCPHCQGVETVVQRRGAAKCWCGRVNVKGGSVGANGSCGAVCKGRACAHMCTMRCHPGPCPPCGAVRELSCYCGRGMEVSCAASLRMLTQAGLPCDAVGPVSCERECGKMLACGRHHCTQPCHEDSCPPCAATVVSDCHCGHVKGVEVACVDAVGMDGDDAAAASEGKVVGKLAHSCGRPCEGEYECKEHDCERKCHAGPCGVCRRDPTVAKRCPCGRTPLTTLGGAARSACTDPLPTCRSECGRVLDCGTSSHKCKQTCHDSPCPPCTKQVQVKCRCGRKTSSVPCEEVVLAAQRPDAVSLAITKAKLCTRRCNTALSCRRPNHTCAAECCASYGSSDVAAHTCTAVCGRRLQCGSHSCEDPCHYGPCPPCMHVITDPISCPCGASVVMPPQPCGTRPPPCRLPCRQTFACGHHNDSINKHECHPGPCPPCQLPVDRLCAGEHCRIANVRCSGKPPTCSSACKKPLACGKHTCPRTCHVGSCDPSIPPPSEEGRRRVPDSEWTKVHPPAPCKEKCMEPLPCGHSCAVRCHVGRSCREAGGVTSCAVVVKVPCPCGRRRVDMPCRTHQKKVVQQTHEAVEGQPLPPLVPCDSACAAAERAARMAEGMGLQIDVETGARLAPPWRREDNVYWDEATRALGARYPDQVAKVEQRLAQLLGTRDGVQSVMIPTMSKREHRALAHAMCYVYGLTSESQDKHMGSLATLFVNRTPHARVPSPLLSEVVAASAAKRAALEPPDPAVEPMRGVTVSGFTVETRQTYFERVLQQFGGNYAIIWHDDESATLVFSSLAAARDGFKVLKDACPRWNVVYPAQPPQEDSSAPRKPPKPAVEVHQDGWATQLQASAADFPQPQLAPVDNTPRIHAPSRWEVLPRYL